MKNKIILSLAFAALLFSAGKSNAQTVSVPYNGQEITVVKDTCAQLTLFTGKYCEGKTYLHWDVKSQQCDGLYIIYKSFDDKSYEVLGHKQGIGVPVVFPIAYYFQDENPKEGTTYYKVVHIAKDKTYLVSRTISVVRSSEISSEATSFRNEKKSK